MSRFLINQCVLFDEDNYTLQRWPLGGDEPLKLGAFASRCLVQLLHSRETVVRKRDLMDGAWGQFGLEVTDNSLAQVVRQLRVSLEKLMPGQECIITVPRIGYKLSEQLSWQPPEAVTESPDAPPDNPPAPADARPLDPPARESSMGRWLVGWVAAGLLAFGAGSLLHQSEIATSALTFAPPVAYERLLIHLPVGSGRPADSELRQWGEQALRAAQLAQLQTGQLHLYLLEPQKLKGFLCDGPLREAASDCLGMLSQ